MKAKFKIPKMALANMLALLLLGLSPGSITTAYVQGTTDGSIAGTVVDLQGAVIPGAKVVVKSKTTGQTYNATVMDNGTFRINNVQVGTYTVTISAQNFKTYSNADVQVQLNRVTDVNATLEAGAVSETVNVTAG